MRMRKKRNGAQRIAACDEYIIHDPTEIPQFPVELEIGCGKGSFILELSKRNPDVNYVAMERVSDVILLAAEKIKSEEAKNVKFIVGDAKNLPEMFPQGSVRRSYLNFSDPWPKKGYYKRRLTYRGFLEIYKNILVPDGEIIFKTDNSALFDFSLESVEGEEGFELTFVSRDLHASERAAENIMTEYERNFSEKGVKINCLEAVKK